MNKKYCSRCKEPFGCNNTGSGCWCQDYTLSTQTLAELKTGYDDCLCPKCLSEFTETTAQKSRVAGNEE